MNLYSKELINESINILEDYRRKNDIERATELINIANSFIENGDSEAKNKKQFKKYLETMKIKIRSAKTYEMQQK